MKWREATITAAYCFSSLFALLMLAATQPATQALGWHMAVIFALWAILFAVWGRRP